MFSPSNRNFVSALIEVEDEGLVTGSPWPDAYAAYLTIRQRTLRL